MQINVEKLKEEIKRYNDLLEKYESSYILTWRHIPPKGNRPPVKSDHDDQLRQMKASGNYLFFEDIK